MAAVMGPRSCRATRRSMTLFNSRMLPGQA
jgi:hypothetical protein